MRRTFRKTLLCIVIAAILITALPAAVFAGGGGDSGPDRSELNSDINIAASSGNAHRAEKHSSDGYYYVLAVNAGTYIGSSLQEIILKYTSSADDSHVRYQVLRPSFNLFSASDSELKKAFESYASTGRQGRVNTIGSVYTTFADISESTSGTHTQDGQSLYHRNFASYSTWASELMNGKLGAESIDKKISADAVFSSGRTTYIAFETEYDLVELKSVQFYFENLNGSGFSCNGWEMYKVPYGEKLRYENYAFFSDSIDVSFNGTMIYKTTAKTNAVISATGLNTDQYDAISHVFYPISDINKVPKESQSQRVIDGEGSAIEDYHFFESCNIPVSCDENRKVLNFAVDIADSYGAGLDSFIRTPGTMYVSADNQLKNYRYISDVLQAVIEFKDSGGHTRTVSVPVISNALFEYAINNDENLTSGNTAKYQLVKSGTWISIAQQGESLCFSVEFPDITQLISVTLTYKDEMHDEDDFVVGGISVYDNWGESRRVLRDAYTLLSSNSIDMAPLGATLLYESDNAGAIRMTSSGTTFKFRMNYSNAKETCVAREKNYEGQNIYLVTLKTDTTAKSGTTDNVYVQFTYDTIDGKVAQSLEYNIQESCEDYMGYNLIAENTSGEVFDNKGDGSYLFGMRSGGEISFLMSIKNVKSFSSANFRIANTEDEWQLGSIKIVKLDTLSRRRLNSADAGEYKLIVSGKEKRVKLNGVYTRSYTGDTLVEMEDVGVYLINGETRTLSFSNAVVIGDHKVRDFSEYESFMDYSTAMSDLKFDSPEKDYEVRVKVASNSSSATTNDDCGSSNLFYFQLVFKNGKRSAYVLANQQLAADGFRSGQIETFTISCNTDMGDVVSINIIPDDSTAESQALDKLCIDNIEVIKHNAGSVNKRFYAANVGWVAPVYRDITAQTEVEGRTESQLASNVVITSFGYMLQLEFDISYGDYPLKQDTGEAYPQFEGNMLADISYYTTNNEFKTLKGVQLVKKMYQYNGKSAVIDERNSVYVSDPEWMFRERTTDRFIVDLDDISQLVSIKLIGSPNENTILPINEITASILRGDGVLKMNTNEEYQMCYEADPIFLAEVNDPTPTGKYSFTAKAKDARTFTFSDNEIPDFDEKTNLESAIISRVPDSSQDTMNLFIYMNPETPDPDPDDYTLTSTISYNSSATTNSYKTMTSDYKNLGKDSMGRTVLLAEGLTANNMSVITNINLSCEHIRRNDIKVDHAVLQQVRNGVVINTYNVAFQSAIIGKSGGVSSGPNTLTNLRTDATKQVVTLQLGNGTMDYKLSPEVVDIAVALKYTTNAKGAVREYTSQYVFATDDPNCTSINTGKILTFEFDEVGVDQITGIKVVAVGGVPATVEAATVICYEADSNNASRPVGYFSFEPRPDVDTVSGIRTSNPIVLSRNEVEIKYSDDNIIYANTNESADFLRRFDITFKTMDVSDIIDSAGTVPIRMRVSYKQHNGNKTTSFKTIADIRNFISHSEGFVAGAETQVSVYLPGLESVYAIEIEPYDNSEASLCSWNLESIKYQLSGTDDESVHTIPVQKTVYEDSPLTVNLSTIYVELGYQYGDVRGTIVNSEGRISAEHGTSIVFNPVIYQGTAGYKVVVYRIVDDGERPIQTFGSDSPSFIYKAENNGNSTALYKIVVSSNDNAAAYSTVYITIPAQSDSTQTGTETGTGNE